MVAVMADRWASRWTGFTPSRYQADLFDAVADSQDALMVSAVAGSGKCLGKDTPVMLFDGSVISVQDVKQGDLLMGMDSKPRKVLSTNQGWGMLYQITPTKGMPWVCNDVHVMTLIGTNRKKDQIIDVPLDKLIAEHKESGRVSELSKYWKLFRVSVDFPEQPLEVEPYLVGVWLGDGKTDDATFYSVDDTIIDYLVQVAPKYQTEAIVTPMLTVQKIRLRGSSIKRGVGNRHSSLRQFFRNECRNGEDRKHIPQKYLINSRENRLQLLAGLIDTDGYYERGCYEIATKWEHLADQICYLARSLGFAAYKSDKIIEMNGNGGKTYYRVSISGDVDEIPCKMDYKQAYARKQCKRVNVTGWTAEPIGEGEYFGFTLDGDGRFLLGDFTVTHNTTSLVKLCELLPGDVLFAAFNKHVAEELQRRLGQTAQAKTVHSLGNSALYPVLGRTNLQQYKYSDLCKQYAQDTYDAHFPDADQKVDDLAAVLKDLHHFSVAHLTDPADISAMIETANHFNVEVHGWDFDLLCHTCLVIREEGERLAREQGVIDFTDMLYLPIAWDLRFKPYHAIAGDEVQDWSKLQSEVVSRAMGRNGRFVGVGDVFQSIMGFSGANCDSFDNLKARFSAKNLPLSICYRCPTSHLKLAQEIIPHIEAAPGAIEGTIEDISNDQFLLTAMPGDMVLCRKTAPLIKACLQLITKRVKAAVRGRDIGAGLQRIVKRIGDQRGFTWNEYPRFMNDWADREVARLSKKKHSESQIEALWDKLAGIDAVCDAYAPGSIKELNDAIGRIFDDKAKGIVLSTVHRAKGLEADRVFIIDPDCMPLTWKGQQPWEKQQEMNIKYVALTRAKKAMYFVRPDKE